MLVFKSQRRMINISGGLPLVSSREVELFCSRKCHMTTLLYTVPEANDNSGSGSAFAGDSCGNIVAITITKDVVVYGTVMLLCGVLSTYRKFLSLLALTRSL